MTTSMKPQDKSTAERSGRKREFNRLWLLLPFAIAFALVWFAVYQSNELRNEQAQTGTSNAPVTVPKNDPPGLIKKAPGTVVK